MKYRQLYNPFLDDPCVAASQMTPAMTRAAREGTYMASQGPEVLHAPDESHPANCYGSAIEDGMHRPCIDVDMQVNVIESSTPGHFHLLFPDIEVSTEDYFNLLEAMVKCGIVEPGYVAASRAKGQTILRLPGVPK